MKHKVFVLAIIHGVIYDSVEGFSGNGMMATRSRLQMKMVYDANLHCDDDEYRHQKDSNRRRIIITTLLGPALYPLCSDADEPSNIQMRSQADDEDPIAAFSKSLQNMSFNSDSIIDASKDSSPSFNDISLPSSVSEDIGSDLGQAIQQKKQEQKRRVDPRTHG